jgi:hypothetical protein
VIRNVKNLHAKCPLLLSYFHSTRIFSTGFRKNFMKILPVRYELFHAGGRADMTEPIVALRNFGNAPTKAICSVSARGRFFLHPTFLDASQKTTVLLPKNSPRGTIRIFSRSQYVNPLTPELNPSAQRCLLRIFTGDFNF